jgi:hypothetical protein
MRYTAQGLGDRIHLISLSYEISIAKQHKVILHLAAGHLDGRKKSSFSEILSLFPNGFVELRFHKYRANNDADWRDYLLAAGIDANSISYRDHPGWLETLGDLDASHYLLNRHLITPSCSHNLKLPEKYITTQWDSTGRDRLLPKKEISRIENLYREEGYQIVVVGGQCKDEILRDCLSCSAVAIYKSTFFAGVDSGFLHLALQIKAPSAIHFYIGRRSYWSHHSFRAIEMGTVLNYHSYKLGWFEFLYVKLRYDSPGLTRLAHQIRKLVGVERYETND